MNEGNVIYKTKDKSLWQRLKAYCSAHDMEMGSTMDEILAEFLNKVEPGSAALLEKQARRMEYVKSFDDSKKLRKKIGNEAYQTFSQAYKELGGKEDYSKLSEITPKLAERFLRSTLRHEYVLFEYYLELRQKMYEIEKKLYVKPPEVPDPSLEVIPSVSVEERPPHNDLHMDDENPEE